MTCTRCQGRVKNWTGDDPKCAFPNDGAFTADNWNCATTGAIRRICDEGDNTVFCDDQKYAALKVSDVTIPSGHALTLWVSWYKSRGRTEAMWLLSEDEPPRVPTAADLDAIIEHLDGV